jgi:hypothetical protein
MMAELRNSEPLSLDGLRDRSGRVPFGKPGTVWMSLVTAAASAHGTRASIAPWSPGNWEKFTGQLQRMPLEASAKLSVLDDDGYPDVPFVTASVERYPDQGDWVVLRCDGSTSRDDSAEDARANRRVWADFLRDHAERAAVGFGYLSDEADFSGPRTALEASLGLFPEETIGLLDRQLRGYSWITVVSAGVAERLGGPESIMRSGAFDLVAPLPSGAAWLEAAPDLSEYGPDRQRHVFEALAKALPPGMPRRDRRARNRRLVYLDAAEATAAVEGR